jgi:CsoR family transcriptional regulator, copper-sensing transcriptional repressor
MNKQLTEKQKMIHRIRIIQGHLKGIEKMLEEGQYCVNIIHQSMAVQEALKKMNQELIRNHLHSCVIHQIKNGNEDKAIKELIEIYEKK